MGRAGRVVAFGDLGIHRLLLQVPDLAELRGFADEVLGKLSASASDQALVYLATLACYFRENASPQRASQVLHVHPNTVTYRIRRVEEITGLDLGSYRDRLMAQVALEILDAVGEAP
jgi:DNA-binding PucR family transcriptional regulator